MERNIEAYVKVYDNWIPHEVCDRVVDGLQTATWVQHTYHDPQTNQSQPLNADKELDVTHESPFSNEVHEYIWQAYRTYLTELNFEWFSTWEGFTPVRFNRYTKNTLMSLHCDHIHSAFDGQRKGIPTMTCLAVLNDGYAGGEFIMFDDKEIKLGKGSAVVFPSVFLYPHLVKPVTEGVRYSCVSWAW